MAAASEVWVYKGNNGKWWWRAKSKNYKIIGASEQGFRYRWYAVKRARSAFPDTPVIIDIG